MELTTTEIRLLLRTFRALMRHEQPKLSARERGTTLPGTGDKFRGRSGNALFVIRPHRYWGS
jgi:hypothetical protein